MSSYLIISRTCNNITFLKYVLTFLIRLLARCIVTVSDGHW